MSHSRHRTYLAVLLAATLTTLPLPASAQTKERRADSPRVFLTHLTDFLGLRPLASVLGLDSGCQMDPSGACLPQGTDSDCRMDPNGKPVASCGADR